MWILLLALLFICTKILVLVPVLGIIFVLLIPVFIAGLMDGCRALDRGEALKIAHIASGFRHNAAQLVTLGGISLVGNLIVVMLVIALGGEAMGTVAKTLSQNGTAPQLTPELQAATAVVGRALLVATLVSLPLLMALWYAPLLVYFHDAGPLVAMKSSFFACLKNTMPLLVYGVVILIAMFIVMPFAMALGQYDLALWLLAPVVLPSLYVSYKDIYLVPETRAVDSTAS